MGEEEVRKRRKKDNKIFQIIRHGQGLDCSPLRFSANFAFFYPPLIAPPPLTLLPKPPKHLNLRSPINLLKPSSLQQNRKQTTRLGSFYLLPLGAGGGGGGGAVVVVGWYWYYSSGSGGHGGDREATVVLWDFPIFLAQEDGAPSPPPLCKSSPADDAAPVSSNAAPEYGPT